MVEPNEQPPAPVKIVNAATKKKRKLDKSARPAPKTKSKPGPRPVVAADKRLATANTFIEKLREVNKIAPGVKIPMRDVKLL